MIDMNKEKISLILKIIFYISFGIFIILFPFLACCYDDICYDYSNYCNVSNIELLEKTTYCMLLVVFMTLLISKFMEVDIFGNKRKMESDE